MEETLLVWIIEYVWVPIVTALILLWRKISGLDTRSHLLEQADRVCTTRRTEDNKRFERDRRESLDKIDSHHKVVMTKLDNLETRIKNGH